MNTSNRDTGSRPGVICFGEAMAELADLESERVRIGVGGDTFNTAVYLSRLGTPVRFATALGQDPFSARIRARMSAEALSQDLVLTSADSNCGLYAIEVDEAGERSFTYWREHSAAREFFSLPRITDLEDEIRRAAVFYLSGITLSLFSAPERQRIAALASMVRANGGQVVFDTNYRPAGWASAGEARDAITALMPHVSIALPTFEDDTALFGFGEVEACANFWQAAGAEEVVVKCGPRGAWSGQAAAWIAPPEIISPIDTTGAGDSFNAGYLNARLSGFEMNESIAQAHRLAAAVLGVRGALLPMDALLS
jgi:2-dehydro-3-deoxygluconokinase